LTKATTVILTLLEREGAGERAKSDGGLQRRRGDRVNRAASLAQAKMMCNILLINHKLR
jgi:hypothetical protein